MRRKPVLATWRVPAAAVAIAAVVALCPPTARAAEPLDSATFVVTFAASEPESDWVAAVLEKYVTRALGNFDRLEPMLVPRPACGPAATECLVDAYAKHGAEIIVTGTFKKGRLYYRIHESWTGARVHAGNILIEPGLDPLRVRQEFVGGMNPVLRSGGLLEQRDYLKERAQQHLAAKMAGGKTMRTARIFGGVAGILLLFAPYLLLSALQGFAAVRRTRTWRGVLITLGVLTVVLATSAAPGVSRAVWGWSTPDAWLRYQATGTALLAGLCWGAFGLLFLRISWPPLYGAERAEAQTLGPLLRAWLVVGGMRSVVTTLLCAPLAGLVVIVAQLLHLDAWTAWVIAAPVIGFIGLLWALCVVDVLSVYLDAHLVEGPADADDAVVRRYVAGHQERLGISLRGRVLGRTVFLPGKGAEIVAYGGGLAPARIVVSAHLREVAFGAKSTGAAAATGATGFAHWAQARVLPGGDAADVAPTACPPLWDAPPRTREPLGRLETLMGTVVPSVQHVATMAKEQTAMRNLLAMRRLATGPAVGPEDDFTQRDFLFGGILRCLGEIHRGDALLQTVSLAARVAIGERFPALRRLWRRAFDAVVAPTGHAPTVIADAYVALHNGVHHMAQYLAYLRWNDAGALTARATLVELVNVTHGIIERVSSEAAPQADAGAAAIRRRLIWLSRFTHAPVVVRRAPWGKLAAGAVAAAVLIALFTRATLEAVTYHPIFTQRIQEQRAQLDSGDNHGKRTDN